MRKSILLAILINAAFACVACAQAQPKLQTTRFYPLEVGTRWTYAVSGVKGLGGKEEPRSVTIEVEDTKQYVRKTKISGKDAELINTGFLLKTRSGAKVTRDHVVVLEDGVYKVDVAGTLITPPLCFIKLGGDSPRWEADNKIGNTTAKGTFTIKTDPVTVPLGSYKNAILITFNNGKTGDERIENDVWYVSDFGMVKQRVIEKGHEITLTLEKYEPAKVK